MKTAELRDWLKTNPDLPDQWWVSVDGTIMDDPQTLAGIDSLCRNHAEVQVVHISKADGENPVWVVVDKPASVIPLPTFRQPRPKRGGWIGSLFLMITCIVAGLFAGVFFIQRFAPYLGQNPVTGDIQPLPPEDQSPPPTTGAASNVIEETKVSIKPVEPTPELPQLAEEPKGKMTSKSTEESASPTSAKPSTLASRVVPGNVEPKMSKPEKTESLVVHGFWIGIDAEEAKQLATKAGFICKVITRSEFATVPLAAIDKEKQEKFQQALEKIAAEIEKDPAKKALLQTPEGQKSFSLFLTERLLENLCPVTLVVDEEGKVDAMTFSASHDFFGLGDIEPEKFAKHVQEKLAIPKLEWNGELWRFVDESRQVKGEITRFKTIFLEKYMSPASFAPSDPNILTVKGFWIGMDIEDAADLINSNYTTELNGRYKVEDDTLVRETPPNVSGEVKRQEDMLALMFGGLLGTGEQIRCRADSSGKLGYIEFTFPATDALFKSADMDGGQFARAFAKAYKLPPFQIFSEEVYGSPKRGWECIHEKGGIRIRIYQGVDQISPQPYPKGLALERFASVKERGFN